MGFDFGSAVGSFTTGGLSNILGSVFGGKPGQPATPDYMGAANATGQSSIQAAIVNALMNRANQSNPYGSETWSANGTTHIPGVGGQPGFDMPNYSSTTSLSPEGQQLFDQNQQQQMRLGNQFSDATANPVDFGSMPDYAKTVSDAMYGRATSYLDPQWEKFDMQNRDRLANAGFSVGDEGYTNAMRDFTSQRDQAYGNARDSAIQQGGTIGLNERQQQVSEALAQRNQPLTELNSLRTGAQPLVPNFQSTNVGANATGANLLGATTALGQSQNDMFNSQMGTYNSKVSALGTLGAGAAAYFF